MVEYQIKKSKIYMFFISIFLCLVTLFGFLNYSINKAQKNAIIKAEPGVDLPIASVSKFNPELFGTWGTAFGILEAGRNLVGTIWNCVEIGMDDTSETKAKDICGAIFGNTESAIAEGIIDIKKKLDVMDTKIETISNDISTIKDSISDVNKSLIQINNALLNISKDIGLAVEQLEFKCDNLEWNLINWTEIYNELNNFTNKYSDIRNTLEAAILNLKCRYVDYQNVINASKALPNVGTALGKLLDTLTLNISKFNQDKTQDFPDYNGFTQDEKILLQTEVSYKSVSDLDNNGESDGYIKVEVGKFIYDFYKFLYSNSEEVYKLTIDGSNLNLANVLVNMADKILGNGSYNFEKMGLGELYYRLCIMKHSNSYEVHSAYQTFVSEVLYDFMLMNYVANTSINLQISLIKANSNNQSQIGTLLQSRNTIKPKLQEVLAYMDYEYKHCIKTYDIANFNNFNSNSLDSFNENNISDYVVYYDNSINRIKYKQVGTKYISKKDLSPNNLVPNEQYVYLATAESYKAKIYYQFKEIQNKLHLESSDNKVAIVSDDGIITALNNGSCMIGYKDKGEFKPLINVNVSDALAEKSNDKNDRFLIPTGKESEGKPIYKEFVIENTSGQGIKYTYNYNIHTSIPTFDTLKETNFDFNKKFDIEEIVGKNYTLSSQNEDIIIENNIVICRKPTSGCITAKKVVDDKVYIVNIPVLNRYVYNKDENIILEKDDKFIDKNNNFYTKYLYNKNDLFNLRQDIENMSEKTTTTSFYIYLMNDIDMEYAEWEPLDFIFYKDDMAGYVPTLTFIDVDFDGNGCKIKNLTLAPNREHICSFFGDYSGDVHDLEFENIKFKNSGSPNLVQNAVLMKRGVSYKKVGDVAASKTVNISDITISGNIEMSVNKNFKFSPFFALDAEKDPIDINMVKVARTIYRANTLIDCNNKDITGEISIYKNNYEYPVNNEKNNFFLGNINIENIVDMNKITLPKLVTFNDNSFDNTKQYFYSLFYSYIIVQNTLKENKVLFSGNGQNLKDHSASLLDPENISKFSFWTNLGFTENKYYIKNSLNIVNIPRIKHQNLIVDITNFKLNYGTNEKIDFSKLKIYLYDKNITNEGNFSIVKSDKTPYGENERKLPGEAFIKFTYKYNINQPTLMTTFIKIDFYLDDKPFGKEINITYKLNNNTFITDIARVGIDTTLKGKEIYNIPGYELKGWMTGTGEYQLNSKASFYKDMVFEAVVDDLRKPFTLNIYKQNLLDDEYVLTETKTAKHPENILYPFSIPEYQGYELNSTFSNYVNNDNVYNGKYDALVKTYEILIDADGSTVVNLYYDRKMIKATFVLDSSCTIADKYTITESYKYGTILTKCPIEFKDNNYYIFVKFDKPFEELTDDITYTAEYTEKLYTITFKNGDEVISVREDYYYNEIIILPTKTPLKPSDETYTYEFEKWDFKDNRLGKVMKNDTFYPIFTKTYKEYTLTIPENVIVKKGDKALFNKNTVHYNDILNITYVESKGHSKDTFNVGNANLLENNNYQVKGNVNIEYTEKTNQYTYKFVDENNVLKEVKANYGETIIPPTEPIKNADKIYTYTFSGWNPTFNDGDLLEEDITFNSVYTKTYINYTITNPYTIQNKDLNNGYIEVISSYHYNDIVKLNIVPNEGYKLFSISLNPNVELNDIPNYKTFTLLENTSIICEFVKINQELVDKNTNNEVKVDANIDIVGKDASITAVKEKEDSENFINIKNNFKNAKNIAVFNITLKDKDGTELNQLNGMVSLSLKIPVGFDATKLKVYRVDGEEKIEYEFNIYDDYAVINTDHFSTYVLVEVKHDSLILILSIIIPILMAVCIVCYIIILNRKHKIRTLERSK